MSKYCICGHMKRFHKTYDCIARDYPELEGKKCECKKYEQDLIDDG